MPKAHDIKAKLGLAGSPLSHIPGAPPELPDHEMVRCIGQGSYGEVWLARNAVGTWRAVKVVHRARFNDDRPYEREFIGIQKYEPISRTNDGLVDVLQTGRNDREGYFCYVMELADDASAERSHEVRGDWSDGPMESRSDRPAQAIQHSITPPFQSPTSYAPKTLAREIRTRARLPVEECITLGMTLNLALGHLHRNGLIHRDVKPSNIIFVNGVPKLADIGLVTDMAEAQSFVGTEGFIPPEGPNSPQADLYALGKVLYEASMGKDRHEFPEPYTGLGVDAESKALMEFNAVLLRACAARLKDRYRSAEEMNADLALLHSGESVRDKHALQRRLKITRRVTATIAAVMVLGVVPYFLAIREARLARRAARKSDEVARLLSDMLEGVGPSVAKGRDTALMHEILDKTAERVGNELKNEPEVEADLRDTLGHVYQVLGDYAEAEQMCRIAVDKATRAVGEEDELVAKLLNNLATVLKDQDKLAEAETTHRRVLQIARKVFGREHEHVADSLDNLAIVLHAEGKLAEAETAHHEALNMRRKLFGNKHEAVAYSLNNLGGVIEDEGRFDEAESLHRQALAMRKELHGDWDIDVATSLGNLGLALQDKGKLAEAEQAFCDALAIQRKLLPKDHPLTARALHNLACALRAERKLAEAGELEREALAIVRKKWGNGRHPDVAIMLAGMAAQFREEGKPAEAESAYREALEIRRKLKDGAHLSVATSLNSLARLLRMEGKLEEAERLARECLAIRQAKLPDDWRTFETQLTLGGILLQQKDDAAAEPLLRSGYAGMCQRQDRIPAVSKLHLREGLQDLVKLREEMGHPDQAAEWKRELDELEHTGKGENLAVAPAVLPK